MAGQTDHWASDVSPALWNVPRRNADLTTEELLGQTGLGQTVLSQTVLGQTVLRQTASDWRYRVGTDLMS